MDFLDENGIVYIYRVTFIYLIKYRWIDDGFKSVEQFGDQII